MKIYIHEKLIISIIVNHQTINGLSQNMYFDRIIYWWYSQTDNMDKYEYLSYEYHMDYPKIINHHTING